MSDGPVSPELVRVNEHPLEGGVIVHGFLGNIGKPEDMTLAQVIQAGKLASPSKRSLDPKERARLADAPFDRDRICFHTWKENGEQPVSYIGHAIWSGPVTAMADTIIGDDIANQTGDIFAYRSGGVEIPVETGTLFISGNLVDTSEIRSMIEKRAKQLGITFDEWVRANVVLLPTKTFHQSKDLFSLISQRVQPAAGVSADFVDAQEISRNLKLNFVAPLNQNHEPVSAASLGNASKTEGEPVSHEMMQEWEEKYARFEEEYGEIIAEMDENPLRLEELRDPEYMYDGAWEFHLLHRRLQSFASNSDLTQKLKALDEKRKEALARNEQILTERFPDMPVYDHIPHDLTPKPYREKTTGKIRVAMPF